MDTCTTSLPSAFGGNVQAIGFQVHSHNLGRLITAYYLSEDIFGNEVVSQKYTFVSFFLL